MKRKMHINLLSIFLAVVITTAPFFSVTAFAADGFMNERDYEYRVLSEEDKICEITGYKGFGTDVAIPQKIDGYRVVRIGDYAFYDKNLLQSVKIPEGITSIGHAAFQLCALQSISIPGSLSDLEDYVFIHCHNLKSVFLPDSLKSIGEGTFYDCQSLERIIIPNGVTDLKDDVFSHCISLKSVFLPDSLKSIGKEVFVGCPFEQIIIPDSVTSIGEGAFEDCTSLNDIIIGKGLTAIPNNLFYDCSSLSEIIIPDNVRSIGKRAFAGTSLTNIKIHKNLVEINSETFTGCKTLTDIIVSENNPNYCDINGVLFSKDNTQLIKHPEGRTAANYRVPAGVISIGDYAFIGTHLQKIEIPNSVISIGEWAFYGSAIEKIEIPDSVESIGWSAFSSCSLLKEIKIPASVINLGNDVFSSCVSLERAELAEGITKLPDNAFLYCESLTEVILPDTLNEIDSSAFLHCISLKEIKLPEGLNEIRGSTFLGCYSLERITIPDSVTVIGSKAFNDCRSLKDVTLGKNVELIDWSSFLYCYSLKTISIPKSVKLIERSAFSDPLEVIYGYAGTEAESYAERWHIDFIDLSTGMITCNNINSGDVIISVFDKEPFFETEKMLWDYKKRDEWVMLDAVTAKAEHIKEPFNKRLIISEKYRDLDITLSRKDYQNIIIPAEVVNSWLDRGEFDFSTHNVYMQKDKKNGKPYIAGAYIKAVGEKKEYTDIMNTSKLVTKDSKYDIILTADLNGKTASEYILSQDNEHRLTSKDGRFSAEAIAEKFVYERDVYVFVKTTDGDTSIPVKVKLDIVDLPFPYDDGAINLFGKGGDLPFAFADDVPLLGGSELSFEGFEFPMGLEIEDNRFKISLGVDLWEKKDDKKGKWDLFKKSINDISKNSKDEKDKYEKYKKLKKAIEGEKFESEINKKKFDVDLLGYVEGYIVDGKPIFTGFGGEITGKFQFKHTTQVTVGPIPVYVYAKAGADLSAAIKYAQLFPDRDAPWDLGVVLKGGPLFQVGVGPGIEEAASVGFYGKGNFPFTVDFTNCHLLFQIEGNFGVEASLLCFEYKKPLVEWTWTALDKYYGPAKALRLRANKVLPNQPKLLERQKQTLEASVMSREYLENTSRWQGDSLLKRTFGIRTDIADGLTVKELQTSVFKNSKSQLVSLDDGRMIMAYIEDDGSRDAYNRMRLVYSVCENGFWSKPRAVCDDGTNDDCPVLGTDGKTVYIAWQNTNREFTEDDEKSADSILKSVEISFAEFNTETNEFENSKTLTSNNSYDYIPCIAVENGEAAVYWVNNDQDDLKKPGSNTIYRYSTSKKETESIKSNVNYILNADCTFDEFSYTTDTDGALSDTKDINVFIVSNGKARAVSNSDKADFNVAYGKLEGENTLFYSNMSGVYYYDGNKINSVFETNRSVSGDLQVLENGKETSLIWSETSENGSELWFCNYAEGKWSQPVQITKLGAVLSNIALVYQNGIIHGVFDRSERSFTNDTYVTGQTDLCYMTLADYTELETKFEFFDESMLKPGKTVKIPVNLTNNGTKNIHSVDILLKDTLGTVITANKVVDLLSGADMTVEIDYPVSMNLERTTLEVTATASNEEEINTLNNTDRIELGFADIGIRDVKVEEVGEYFVLTTLISNDNAVVAKDVELKAYSQDKDGKLIGYADIGDLQPGEMKSIQYIVSKNSLEFDEKGIDKICLAVSTSSEEKITDDNITTAVIKGVYILYGDVNGDKVIDGKDVISMRKYFADYNDETETSSVEIFVGADANGDGTVNGKDLILLRQYLANYNDDTGESSVVLGPQGI